MKYTKYSKEDLIQRAFLRLAVFLYGLWEEGDEADTRIFEKLIPDDYVTFGTSTKALTENAYKREHVVPCAKLRDWVFEQYGRNKSCEEVACELRRFLKIVYVHPDEATLMDKTLGLKTQMPENWTFESGSILARLEKAEITIKPIVSQ
jgi:hypothetical protein